MAMLPLKSGVLVWLPISVLAARPPGVMSVWPSEIKATLTGCAGAIVKRRT